ncbi:MAG: M14 family zinc carboxypeptidase [Bacteroidota bacterium]
MKYVIALVIAFTLTSCQLSQESQGIPFLPTSHEQDSARNYTASYAEVIDFYQQLAEAYPQKLYMTEAGITDIGEPLHYLVLSQDGTPTPETVRADNKLVVFVNNAIHPGEPCGVDASMRLVRDYLQADSLTLPKDVVVVIVPMYNIGGMLNRGSYSRANQNGPVEYGFRGNAKNLDLNRDFIKCDSRNAMAFNRLLSDWKPEIFIDNHTSNGADYQYTLTLIAAQAEKLSEPLGKYLRDRMLPHFYRDLPERGWPLTPYVYSNGPPETGIYGFLDLPRYSTGYAALHHSIGFMPETHMLKPYADRVECVYQFMQSAIALGSEDRTRIQAARTEAIAQDRSSDSLAINWSLDRNRSDTILFKGYTNSRKPSVISGQDRLYYDRDQPFEQPVPLFDYYSPSLIVERPKAYIIPFAWGGVIERLQANGVEMTRLEKDTTIAVQQYYIEDFDTRDRPYEGHYLHSNVSVRLVEREWVYRAGDYIASTDQTAVRYLVETLEPQAPDSYFAWNFFDAVLQQKEGFSNYVFEDLAAEYLDDNPDLAAELEAAISTNPELATDGRGQLEFIYKRSPWYEPTAFLYPVGRVMK